MSTYKRIHWNKEISPNVEGQRYANIHFLVSGNGATLDDFQNMAAELRKTFPQALDTEITCGKVTKSRSVDGFSILTWNSYIPEGEYPGWHQSSDSHIEYSW